jgi:predicted NACHT family NTPase
MLDLLAKRCGLGVMGEGGRGKTALCRHIAMRIISNAGPGPRHAQPVIIDGLSYTGNLLDSVVDALKQSRAYVNRTIVESQLSAGNLAIFCDGLSEVRESYREAAEMTNIPTFIRQHPDTPFLFTSRSALPAAIAHALKDVTSIQLKDVDAGTEKEFLGQYLKKGKTEVDAVIRQMNERLGDMPRIPLMLKLVAAVYDQTGDVPEDRPTLLSQYADQLLRPEMTGMRDPSGLRFALRHLVRETYLRSGGDRGFSVDQGVQLLGAVREDLANYDIKLSAIEILSLLIRAGVMRRNAYYYRFFHDSFESYFGARALLADFQRRQYALVMECRSNERVKEAYDFFLHMLDPIEELPRLSLVPPQ